MGVSAGAETYYRTKQFDLAIADYDELLRLRPTSASYLNRGNAWKKKKNFDQALADFNEAIRLNPENWVALDGRGLVWRKKKEYARAAADFAECMRLKPEYFSVYNNAAWMKATCVDENYRNGQEAVELAKKACELTGWTDFQSLDTLAAAYAEAGQFDSAITYQNKALELKPNDPKFVKGAKQRIALYQDHTAHRDE